jgi:hypothetical protein
LEEEDRDDPFHRDAGRGGTLAAAAGLIAVGASGADAHCGGFFGLSSASHAEPIRTATSDPGLASAMSESTPGHTGTSHANSMSGLPPAYVTEAPRSTWDYGNLRANRTVAAHHGLIETMSGAS